jgi:hypothetical protein
LKEIAEQQGVSVAELIRRAVDTWLCDTGYVSLEQRRQRAVAAASGFETGITDLARNHDAYFTESTVSRKPHTHDQVVA